MARETHDPNPQQQSPRPDGTGSASGTGRTGNPCEYPGCKSRNARARVDWSREGLDDRAADQSLRTLCDKHRNKHPKRSAKSSGRSAKARKFVPRPRKASKGSVPPAKYQAPQAGKGSAEVSPKLPTEVVRLQRARERAAAVLPSDPAQAVRICEEALRNESGLRAARRGPAGGPGGKKLPQLLDELGALQRKAETAQHAVVEREHAREQARAARVRKAADTGPDQSWLNGRRPIGISELLEVRALVVKHLDRGRDREAARLCSKLLTTGEAAMSVAGREGDRMRSFFLACRTEAYNNMRAKGVIPTRREDAAGQPVQGRRGNQNTTTVPQQRQRPVQQLGAFTKKGARYVKAQQMMASDSRRAVQLCDAALSELKRMPSSPAKKKVRALWVELRDEAVSARKRERSDATPGPNP